MRRVNRRLTSWRACPTAVVHHLRQANVRNLQVQQIGAVQRQIAAGSEEYLRKAAPTRSRHWVGTARQRCLTNVADTARSPCTRAQILTLPTWSAVSSTCFVFNSRCITCRFTKCIQWSDDAHKKRLPASDRFSVFAPDHSRRVASWSARHLQPINPEPHPHQRRRPAAARPEAGCRKLASGAAPTCIDWLTVDKAVCQRYSQTRVSRCARPQRQLARKQDIRHWHRRRPWKGQTSGILYMIDSAAAKFCHGVHVLEDQLACPAAGGLQWVSWAALL